MMRLPKVGQPSAASQAIPVASATRTEHVGQATPAGPAAPPRQVSGPGSLGEVQAKLEAELATLESEARGLTAELQTIKKSIAAASGDVDKLGQILKSLESSRAQELEKVKTARALRREQYEAAKGALDEHLSTLKNLGLPEPEVEGLRKKLFIRLARSAIRAGTPSLSSTKNEGFGEILDQVKELALKSSGPRKRAAVERAISSLAEKLASERDQIGAKQRTLVGHRSAAAGCAQKALGIAEKIESKQGAIEAGTKRLGEIQPRLDEVNRRIGELKAAINVIKSLVACIRMEEEASQRRHEQFMQQADEAQRDRQLEDLRKNQERLEELLRAASRTQRKLGEEISKRTTRDSKVSTLERAILDVRTASQRPGASGEEIKKALITLEQLVRSVASTETTLLDAQLHPG